jgi:hypothetical protein
MAFALATNSAFVIVGVAVVAVDFVGLLPLPQPAARVSISVALTTTGQLRPEQAMRAIAEVGF